MHKISLILSCIIVLMAGAASSQTLSVNLIGNMSFPIGDYASTTSDNPGYAKVGFGAGLEIGVSMAIEDLFSASTGIGNVGIIGQARVIWNPTDDYELQEFYYDEMMLYWYQWDGLELKTLSMDAGRYINIPLMGGAKLEVRFAQNLMFVFKGLGGINLSMLPEHKFPMTVYDESSGLLYAVDGVAKTYGTGITFCLGIGAGLTNGRMDIGLEYLYLGEPEMDGSISIKSDETVIDRADGVVCQKIAMMNISVGFRF